MRVLFGYLHFLSDHNKKDTCGCKTLQVYAKIHIVKLNQVTFVMEDFNKISLHSRWFGVLLSTGAGRLIHFNLVMQSR